MRLCNIIVAAIMHCTVIVKKNEKFCFTHPVHVQYSDTAYGRCIGKEWRGDEIHAAVGKSTRNTGHNARTVQRNDEGMSTVCSMYIPVLNY